MNAPEIKLVDRVFGLEPDQYVEYFGYLPDMRPFVIFRPRDNWDYTKFRCFIGGVEVAVHDVVRYRDGGTTDITLGRGDPAEIHKFHFPSCFNKDDSATYDGVKITSHERYE